MLVANKLSDWNVIVLPFVCFGCKFNTVAPFRCFCWVAVCGCCSLKEILLWISNLKNFKRCEFSYP